MKKYLILLFLLLTRISCNNTKYKVMCTDGVNVFDTIIGTQERWGWSGMDTHLSVDLDATSLPDKDTCIVIYTLEYKDGATCQKLYKTDRPIKILDFKYLGYDK